MSKLRRVGRLSATSGKLHRPQQVPELAAARLAQALRWQVADGVEHHAPCSHPRGLVNLIANGAIGVEPQSQGMANHRGSVLVRVVETLDTALVGDVYRNEAAICHGGRRQSPG